MTGLLEKNLAQLPAEIAELLRHANGEIGSGAADTLVRRLVITARSGHVITGIEVAGAQRFFHSRYDPVREADRLAAGIGNPVVIVPGFGSGYHLRPLLEAARRVIVVEPDPALLYHTLGHVDLREALRHPGLTLVTGATARRADAGIGDFYRPAVHGSATVLELPGIREAEPERYARLRQQLRDGLEQLKDDFAVQSRFGRLWLRNTVANLHTATRPGAVAMAALPRFRDRTVVVVAAGPSLEDALPLLGHTDDAAILSTDTALPVLTDAGIRPDAVLTVDAQQVSYHHYLSAQFPETLLLADLSAPPAVFQCLPRVLPLLSSHPLHQLLRLLGVDLPLFDSSGGNVSHAAVSLASCLGASVIRLVGADFSYPDGRTYARDTSIHRYFRCRSLRTQPLATLLHRFLHERPGLYPDAARPGILRQPALDSYRTRLEALVRETGARVEQVAGRGIPLELPGRRAGPGIHAPRLAAPRPPGIPANTLERLRSLLAESEPTVAQLDSRTASAGPGSHAAVATALLPLLAWHRRNSPDAPADALLLQSRDEAVSLIDHFLKLSACGPG